MISHFIFEEEGQTLVEYGLLISLLALVAIITISLFGRKMGNWYNKAHDQLPGN